MQKIIRIAIIVIVVLIFFNSLVFIGLGVYKSIHAYILIAQGSFEERPAVHIAEALDSFLISLFFIVFSVGISKLFLPGITIFKSYDLPWLKMDDFSSLKLVLWEMLLTTLFVFFASSLIINVEHLDWTTLITPISILMLALAYKFLKQGH